MHNTWATPQGTGRRRLCLRTMTPVKMTAGFDTETTAAMAEAYDKACRSMHDWGQPVIIGETIAKRIVQLAADGGRDPDELCERALKSLGFCES
jgi:hypothetical protein